MKTLPDKDTAVKELLFHAEMWSKDPKVWVLAAVLHYYRVLEVHYGVSRGLKLGKVKVKNLKQLQAFYEEQERNFFHERT